MRRAKTIIFLFLTTVKEVRVEKIFTGVWLVGQTNPNPSLFYVTWQVSIPTSNKGSRFSIYPTTIPTI